MDPWYPMGKGSMLQGANLLMHTAHVSGYDQIFRLFDMITTNSAITMNVQDQYGIEPGKPANLVILDAADAFDAIRLMSEALYVIRRGKVLCTTQPAVRKLNFEGKTQDIDFKLKK